MKKFTLFCGLVAACLCLAQNANAQYAGPIHRSGAYLADMRGNILSDHEVLNLIGEQIYDETYVGAVKQKKAGKTMIWTGLLGTGVGLAGVVAGSMMVAENAHKDSGNNVVYDNEDKAKTGAMLLAGGYVLSAVGGVLLDIGIPVSIIGKKRLNWVADDYNARKGLTYQIGATPSGVGFALNF